MQSLPDYMQSLGSAAVSAAWGLVILSAFIAAGRWVRQRLGLADGDWALDGTLGMAGVMIFGGWLCAAHVATGPLLVLLVMAGGIVGAWRARMFAAFWNRNWSKHWPVWAILVALIALRFLGEAAPPWYLFNGHDDFHAYLAHPIEIVQTGTFGPDPLSERRLSSLGGQAFLQALMAAIRPPESFRLIDSGIGFLLVAGMAARCCRRAKLSEQSNLIVTGFVVLFVVPDVNATTLMTGIALFLLLEELLDVENSTCWKKVLGPAIAGAAICSGKSTLVPAVGAILMLYLVRRAARLRWKRRVLNEAVLTLVLMVVLLAPWMWLMWKSSGTPFYPWLGKGYHLTAYQPANPAIQASWTGFWRALLNPFFAPLLLLPFFPRNGIARLVAGTSVAVWVAMCIAIPADAYRYAFPFIFPVLIWIAVSGLQFAQQRGRAAFIPVAVCLAVPLVFMSRTVPQRYYLYLKARTWGYRETVIATREERTEARALQQSVPAGEPLVVRMEKNFLFDFRRNPIWIVDMPGGASPPPGMPLEGNAEALADYLRGQDLRYVAYAYRDEANFRKATHAERLSSGFNPWLREQAQLTFAFQERLAELGQKYRRIFDDGNAFVIDLKR